MWYKVTGGSDDEKIKIRMQTGVNEKQKFQRNRLPIAKRMKNLALFAFVVLVCGEDTQLSGYHRLKH